MNTVGYIAHMTFLRKIAFPNAIEHLLADNTMQLTYAIYFLTSIAQESRHAEFFSMIIRIGTSHSNKLIP